MPEPVLLIGDVVLTTSSHWLSRGIRWATRRRNEDPSRASHAAIVDDFMVPLPEVTIIEAGSTGVRKGKMSQWYGADDMVSVWRPENMSILEREEVVQVIRARIGQGYPYLKLALHLIDEKLLGGKTRARKLKLIDSLVCSTLVGSGFHAKGRTFGKDDPLGLTPDDIEDFMIANPDKWRQVRDWAPFPAPPKAP